jgi:methylated-DNA-[protein]-cysteine S-methyltransferase
MVQTSNFIDIDSPIGLIRVFESNGKITSLNIAVKKSSAKPDKPSKVLLAAKDQLSKYFAGKLTKFDLPVDLSNGTEFQKAVWKQIAKIGFGKKVSYVDIAKAINNPKASRAVGGAVGSNPIPLIVGCHRVLGSTGTITGYSGGKGIPTKKWLLKHEGISASDV